MNTDIIEAIKNRNVIEIYYENQLHYIEPHCYGITKAGNESLKAYQIEASLTREVGWKSYDVKRASDLNVLKQTFETVRHGYARTDKEMYFIFAEL